jgi:hypothetical protein
VIDPEALRAFIVAALRGEAGGWPFGDEPGAVEACLDAARWHGVACLVAEGRRGGGGHADAWPEALRAALEADRRGAAVIEDRHRAEIGAVVDALAEAGIPALLFKGTALAYTVYPRPWLRPRVDTDLLVAPTDRDRARRILEARGYRRTPLIDGSVVMRQAEYVREEAPGVRHAVDLHWAVGNAPVLARLYTFDELWSRAVPVAPVSDAARAVAPVDALILAVVHRVAHHGSAPRLVWLYDIGRLAGSLTADGLRAFAHRAIAKRVARVSAAALAEATAAFPVRLALDAEALARLLAPVGDGEPSARYLRPVRRPAALLWRELGLFDTWGERAHCLAQHLFPSRAYMRSAYGVAHPALLPALYAHRLLTGVWRWFRRESG